MLFDMFKRVKEEKKRREAMVNKFEMYSNFNQNVRSDCLFNPTKYEDDYIKWYNETMRRERI